MELEGIGWIALAQDKERWKALMNTVMNIYTLQPTNARYI
jgi:hypothetical protein